MTTGAGRDKRWALFEQKLKERGLASSGIPKAPREGGRLAASFAQQRLLFLEQLTPGSAAYNDHYAIRVSGRLDPALLTRVLDQIAVRHEALRTCFEFDQNGDALQVVRDELRIAFAHDHWRERDGGFDAWVVARGAAEAQAPFDLAHGPLARARLLSKGSDEHVLLFTVHHAVWDGWSSGVLSHELSVLYAALAGSRAAALPPLETQYGDYAAWQRQRLSGAVLGEKVAYWKRELEGAPFTLDLPTDRPRPRLQTFSGKTLYARLDPALSSAIDARARELGRTPFSLLLSTFGVLLGRYSGQRQLLIATPVANRARVELEGLIGCFVNTLPIRVDLAADSTLRSLATQVGERVLGAEPHQDLPFEKLIEALEVERDLSRSPIAQVMFVLQNTPPRRLDLEGLSLSPLEIDAGFAKLDLTLNVQLTGDGYVAAWEYNTDLFDAATVARLIGHYQQLLTALTAAPDQPVFDVELLSGAERSQLLSSWNDTAADYPEQATLHGLFLAQAQRSPQAIALIVGTQRIDYAELSARARAIARRLRQRGVGPAALVGVFLQRDQRLVPALLGVLMSGAAYVPLDPAYPQERIALILEDAGASCILTTRELAERLPSRLAERSIDVSQLDAVDDPEVEPVPGQASDRAYLIYTSGSTGKPKGVEIEHRSAVAFVSWAHSVFDASELSGVLASTSVCFDLSIFEIFGTLLKGGTVILAENALALPALPARSRVTLVNTVPSAALELLRAGAFPPSVRSINLAGEPLAEDLVLGLYALPHVERVYNLYGPSETTTYSTYTLTTRGAWKPTIGKPISNTRAYVLDERQKLVPLGVRGELYLGGAGVARGYLDRPELTAERFLPDPFSNAPGARMYKTGDVARWLANGELEYLGRNDHQIKLRGFRIELGEIELLLRRQPGVSDALVLVREDKPGLKLLVAYVVGAPGAAPAVDALRAAAAAALPEYMVPARIVCLEQMPLSPNGKIDRKRLPAPEEPRKERALLAPRTAVEATLARIWQEVLQVERVGVHDSFFELGGDSIAAMRLATLARRAGLELNVSQIFHAQTLEALAERASAVVSQRATLELPREPFALSPIQSWFFERQLTCPNHYNQSVLVELTAGIDPERLLRAVTWTLARHSALRLCFEAGEHGYRQRFGDAPRVDVQRLRLESPTPDARGAALEHATYELEASLDIEHGLLGHVALFEQDGGVSTLAFVLHHLVVDVVSWHTLLGDVATAYAALALGSEPPSTPESCNYALYVAELERYAQSPAARALAAAWLDVSLELPRLPRDFPSGQNLSVSRESLTWTLEAEAATKLAARARAAYKLGVDEVVLTALCLALSAFCSSQRAVLDVEKHGRELPGSGLDLSDTVGWFTALFPLRFEAAPDDLRAALIAVKEALHGAEDRALAFQTLRYGGDSPARRHLSRLPEREVVYNFLGNIAEPAPSGSPFARVHAGSAQTNHHPENARSHLLEVTAALRDGALQLELSYGRDVHTRATAVRLLEALTAELRRLSEHLASPTVGALTRADFPLARLSQAELDAHHDRWWGKVEDAYPLTAAQHAILVDVLRDPGAGYYVPQLHAVVSRLDATALERSLSWVLRRHTALRTGFAWSGLQEPVQLIFGELPCPITHEDWSQAQPAAREQRLSEFLARDQKLGFSLEQPPLLRLLHARWTAEKDLLVWTIHHAVSDGWSLPIIIAEVLAAYAAYAKGQEPQLPAVRPFRDYVAWLSAQDQRRGEAYFREVLRGATPANLGIPEDASYRQVREWTRELDTSACAELEQLAKRHAVTLGAVVQAAWALVVARYADQRDVIFGSVDSGRPDALEHVGTMVGMFVTTLPLRVQVDDERPLSALLRGVQDASLGLREHSYVALARVARECGVDSLFQSICVIENYPSLQSAAEPTLGLEQLGTAEITRFPLTVTASLRERVTLSVSASLVDPNAGLELLEAWQLVLTRMARATRQDSEILVGALQLPNAERRRAAREYWQSTLHDAPVTQLPRDWARGAAGAREPAVLQSPFDRSLPERVTSLARSLGVAPSALLLGGFAVLVSRYAAQSEVVIAVELEPSRWAPVRLQLAGNTIFQQLAQSIKETLLAARTHFDTAALAAHADRARIGFSACSSKLEQAPPAAFELSLRPAGTASSEHATWTHDAQLFERGTLERLARQLDQLLQQLVSNPTLELREVALTGAVGAVGEAAPATAPTLLDRFRERARVAPTAIAVLSGATTLTYAELDARSRAAAAGLTTRGVTRGDVVAVQLPRSPQLIVALLAILRAGAAFLALDPALPPERARFMLQDANARCCIAQGATASQTPTELFVELASLEQATSSSREHDSARSDLAYVIYTSGSTGQPKGVMIEHASLAGYLDFYARTTGAGPSDRILQFASPSFDVSVEEIFGALCFGATLVLRADDITPRELLRTGQALKLTILSLPTAYWNELTRALSSGAQLPSSVRLVVIGGEQAARDVLAEWKRHSNVRLLNMYGPTEATISATYADLSLEEDADREPPIGRPVTGVRALVVDAFGHAQPLGAPGELLLGGQCLARGYLNRPELTAEKFTHNALLNGRAYHTGDLVRWRSDQQLEYLGRIDQQIKLRGFRVELGEIETALRHAPGVADAAVVLHGESKNPQLVGYVVGSATREQLRRALVALPTYMQPSTFVFLERLPSTQNGKLDRRALPAPTSAGEDQAYVAPRTPTEAALADIWQRVLAVPRVSVVSNFFELGGHSLLATQVVSRIESELRRSLGVRDLFEAPTVAELAERLQARPLLEPGQPLCALQLETAPLSLAQARLWFLDQLEPNSAAYNMPLALRISGQLDIPSLARALAELGQRHSVLRTQVFVDEAGQPQQRVASALQLELALAGAPDAVDAEAWALEQARLEVAKPFDLSRGPLLRARLFVLDEREQLLVLNLHHIAADGWSVGVLGHELGTLYAAFAAGQASPLAALPVQYSDYAVWQRQRLTAAEVERQLGFWKQELDGAPFRLELPKKPRPGRGYSGAEHRDALPSELAERVDALAVELGATPFLLLLAAWATLLSRSSGQRELLIGTPVANRPRLETEALIGLFVNTLTLRADLRAEPSFVGLVEQLRERLLRARAHEDLPFEKLVDALNVERDLERSPLFQVMFAMQNTPAIDFGAAGLSVSAVELSSGVAKFDITLNAERTPAGYALVWEYRREYFEAAFIARLSQHFARLLAALVESPDAPCNQARLLSDDERRQLLVDWNRTERDYPARTVPELVELQAQQTPHAVAVLDETQQLSYRELQERATQLAQQLLGAELTPGARVAVALPRSAELVVALLGIQKAGAAYVPLDPALPHNRQREILEDAGATLLLTETSLLERLPSGLTLPLLCLDQPAPRAAPRPLPPPSPEQLAYVLFTSGSTGRPKGVEITQRALCNFLWSMRAEPGIAASDLVLAATSLSFDIAGLELYLPLIAGASVFVASRQIVSSGQELTALIAERGITYVQATPSTFKMLLSAGFTGSKVLRLLVGGEQLSLQLAEQLLNCADSLWNVYGPTETTIWSTTQRITPESLARGVTIGRPIANTQAFVLDPRLEPVPIGIVGELYLGGHGLARGYAGRPDLTAERFIPNPFGPGRLYRTGDLARYLDDGVLECLGRVDDQIKLRGFRIELGDIEAAIRRHPDVSDVAVKVQVEGDSDQRLVAYVVSPTSVSAEQLRAFLKAALPEYMVPAHFVELERLPTTPNGKLDRKALPRVSFEAARARVAPRDELERRIAGIFSKLLRVPEVGVLDDFFDLGGHSLLGTELVFRLRRELGLDLPVKALFEAPTVAGLAAFARAPVTHSGVRLPPNVVLARQGSGVPWFCFPAIAGTAAPYLPSVVATTGPSVYLLEAAGLNAGQPLDSVEALAADFIQAIRATVSKGPVRLAGWSFGALTAFVAARSLAAEGWPIDELLLLDPALPGMTIGGSEPHQLARAFIADVAESVGKSAAMRDLAAASTGPSAKPIELFRQAQELGIFPSSASASDFENRLSVYTASVRALRDFAPRAPHETYRGRASILAASDGNGPHASAWLQWLPEARLSVEHATHYAILEQLRKYLG